MKPLIKSLGKKVCFSLVPKGKAGYILACMYIPEVKDIFIVADFVCLGGWWND